MKLVIPSAGTGSRLGDYTEHLNKGLVTIGNQPAIVRIISNILQKFSIEEVIVLTGYQADYLEEVLDHFFSDINLVTIRIDKFEGSGSSLSYTLNQAKSSLQCEFIFCANDTLCEIPEGLISPNTNCLAYYSKKSDDFYEPRNYRSIEINEHNEVTKIFPKDYGSDKIYVGLCYVHNFNVFWDSFSQKSLTNGEVAGLSALKNIRAVQVHDWLDCGMITSLKIAQKKYFNVDLAILEKEDESIWFKNDLVVKQHLDSKFIQDRLKRLKFLPPEHTPKIKNRKKYSFSYEFTPGDTITSSLNCKNLEELLNEMQDKVWSKRCTDSNKIIQLRSLAKQFYKTKTLSRVNRYLQVNEVIDADTLINGIDCKPVMVLLGDLDWDRLASNSIFSWFHGDFHNENIITKNGKFTLIDWRQNFTEAEYEFGDAYYDLAKFQHGLLVSHPIVHKGLFKTSFPADASVHIEIMQTSRLLEVNKAFEFWLQKNGYSITRVQLLTALIFLNIAPLHEQPYGEFIFYYGRLLLQSYMSGADGEYIIKRPK